MNFKFDLQLFDGASGVTVNTNIMGDINFAEGVFSIGSGNDSLFTSVGTANSANKSYIPGKANISLAGTFGGNISGTGYSGNTSMTWNGEWENTSHSVAPTTSITVSYKSDSMFSLDFDKTNLSLTSGSIIGTGGTFAENANYSYETNISVTGLSLLKDVSSDVATFKISSDKVKTLNLGGYAGTVELAEGANTGMSIIANGVGAAPATAVTGGQTLKFTASGISFSGKNINVTAGNALNLLATNGTAVLTEGSALTNVSMGKTNDGKVGFDAKGAANINLGEGTDGANVVLSANADVDSVLYKVKNLTYTADADNTSLSLRDLTDSSVSFIGNGKKTTLNLNVTGSSANMDLGNVTSSTVNATLSGNNDALTFTSISKSATNLTVSGANATLDLGELTKSDANVVFGANGSLSSMSLKGMDEDSNFLLKATGTAATVEFVKGSKFSGTGVSAAGSKIQLLANDDATYNFGEDTDGVDVVLNANANVTSALSGVAKTSYSAAGNNTKLTLTGVTNSDVTFYSGSAVSGMNWNLGAFTGSTVNTSDINGTNGTLAFTSISDSNVAFTVQGTNNTLDFGKFTSSAVNATLSGASDTLTLGDVTSSVVDATLSGNNAKFTAGKLTSSTVDVTLSGAGDTLTFTSLSDTATNVTVSGANATLDLGELTKSDANVVLGASGSLSSMSLKGMDEASNFLLKATDTAATVELVKGSKFSGTGVSAAGGKIQLLANDDATYNFGEDTDGVDVVLNANANVTSALSGVAKTSYSAAGNNTKLTLTGVTNSDITFYSGSAVSGMSWNLGAFTGSTVNTSNISGTNGTLAFTSISDSNVAFNIKGKKNVLNLGSATNSDITATVSGESSSVKANSLTGVTATLSSTKDFVSFDLGNVTSSTVNTTLSGEGASVTANDVDSSTVTATLSGANAKFTAGDLTSSTVDATLSGAGDTLTFTSLSDTATDVTVNGANATLDLGELTKSDANVVLGANGSLSSMSLKGMDEDSNFLLKATDTAATVEFVKGSKFSGTGVSAAGGKIQLLANDDATYNFSEDTDGVDVLLNANANVTSALSGANDMTYRSHSEDTRLTLTGVTNSTVKFDVTKNPYWNLGTVTGSTINSSTINGTGGTLAFTSISDSNATFTVQGTNNTLDFGKFTSSAVNATLSGSNDKFNLGDVTSSTVNATLSGEGESVTAGNVTSSTVDATLSGAGDTLTFTSLSDTATNVTVNGANATLGFNTLYKSDANVVLGANGSLSSMSLKGMDEASNFLLKATGTAATVEFVKGSKFSGTGVSAAGSKIQLLANGENTYNFGEDTDGVDVVLNANVNVTSALSGVAKTSYSAAGNNTKLTLTGVTNSDITFYSGSAVSGMSWNLGAFTGSTVNTSDINGTNGTLAFTSISDSNATFTVQGTNNTLDFGKLTSSAVNATLSGSNDKFNLGDVTSSTVDATLSGASDTLTLGDVTSSVVDATLSGANAKFTAGKLTSSTVDAMLSGASDTLTFTSLSDTATNVTVNGANATLGFNTLYKSDAKVVLGANGSVNDMSLTSITQDSSFVLQDTTGEKVVEFIDGSKFNDTGISITGGKLQLLANGDATYNFGEDTDNAEVLTGSNSVKSSISGINNIKYTANGNGGKLTLEDFTNSDADFSITGNNASMNLGDIDNSTAELEVSATANNASVTANNVTSSTVTATLSGANAKFTAGNVTSSTVDATLSGANDTLTLGDVTSSVVDATLSGNNDKFTAGNVTSSTVTATLSGANDNLTLGDVTSSVVDATLSGANAKFTAGKLTSSTVDATLSGVGDTLTFTSLSDTATNVTVNGANATLGFNTLYKSDANVVLGANGSVNDMSLTSITQDSSFVLQDTTGAKIVEFIDGSKFNDTGISITGGKLQLLAKDDAIYKFGEATNNAEVLTGTNSVKSSISGINNIKYTANGNGGKLTLEDFTNSAADFSITGNNASMNLGDIDNSTAELEVSATANNAKFTAGNVTSSTVDATLSGEGASVTANDVDSSTVTATLSGANAKFTAGNVTSSTVDATFSGANDNLTLGDVTSSVVDATLSGANAKFTAGKLTSSTVDATLSGNNDTLTFTSLSDTATNVTVNGANATLGFNTLYKSDANVVLGANGSVNDMSLTSITQDSSFVLQDTAGEKVAEFIDGSKFNDTGISITGGKLQLLTKDDAIYNFDSSTTGVEVYVDAADTTTETSLSGVQDIAYTVAKAAELDFTKVDASKANIKLASGSKGAVLDIDNADENSEISIIAEENGNSGDDIDAKIDLSGIGVETLTLGADEDLGLEVYNWAFKDGEGKANVLDIGNTSLSVMSGGIAGNIASLNVGDNTVVMTSATAALEKGANFDIVKDDTAYNTLILNDDYVFQSEDDLSDVDIFIGKTLNLGTSTKKTRITLDHKLYKDPAYFTEDTAAYYGVTTVIGSSEAACFIIGDMGTSAVEIHGMAHGDSLYAGGSVSENTISSAAGKRGYIGTSANSGKNHIILKDENGNDTNNYEFINADGSNEDTADVTALMWDGGSYINVSENEDGTLNYRFGNNSSNYLSVDGIKAGEYTTWYNDNMDASDNKKAKIDATLTGDSLTYADNIAFYLGNGRGNSKITMNEGDSNKKVNYDGGGVLMEIYEIDGSKGGDGNYLQAGADVKSTVKASDLGTTTISGGQTKGVDSTADTLIGGEYGATTFIIGAEMGDDEIIGLKSGDTVKFLTGKYGDIAGVGVTVSDTYLAADFGASKVSATLKTNLADLKDFTVEFEDATFKWDGMYWTQYNK